MVVQLLDHLRTAISFRPATTDEALYAFMDSQSGYNLVEVYRPFDATKRGHWDDRGCILDYLESTGGGDLLDFGPGDGWPSLPVARFARSVTGVDASDKRVAVCNANAARMGRHNFRCVHYQAGGPLPFADESFDGAMAAHSIEQTPDPAAILRELCRVLKPGGRLRLMAESLERYSGGQEQDLWLFAINEGRTHLTVFDRRVDEERADHYVLILNAPLAEAKAAVGDGSDPGALERIRPWIADAMCYSLRHPSVATWERWLREAGFGAVHTSFSGGDVAAALFRELEPTARPDSMEGVEGLLRPVIRAVLSLPGVPRLDPAITATK